MTEILNRLKQMRAIIEDDIAKNTGLEGESNVQVAVIPECVEIKILDKQLAKVLQLIIKLEI